jgi:hypothetical protein
MCVLPIDSVLTVRGIREEVYPVPLGCRQIFDGKILDEETAKKVW